MKAIKFAEPWKVACVDQEMPTPKEGEALIKIHCAAVCGSDIGAFRGTNGLVSYPRVIGHELSGEILSIPDDPARNPKGLKVGDRVAVDPYIYCGHCYACSIGRTNCCTSLKVLGVHVDGGMCEYFCHPANLLVKLPEGMSYEMGSLAEPLTIALHGIHRGSLKAGEYVAILGAGPIGLYAGMAAEAYGAHAIIIDIVQERLDFAKKMGVEHTINSREVNAVEKVREITGEGAQLVMECSGANILIRQSLDMVCHAGRITFPGWPKQETSLPTDMITRKEIDIRGARTSAGEFEEALELLHSGKVKLMDTVTKIISMEEAPDTIIDNEKNPGDYIKVIVKVAD